MGDVQVLEARFPDGTPCAVLFSAKTTWTFGPIFVDRAEAEAFVAHIKAKYGVDDPRVIGTAPIDDEFLKFITRVRPRREGVSHAKVSVGASAPSKVASNGRAVRAAGGRSRPAGGRRVNRARPARK